MNDVLGRCGNLQSGLGCGWNGFGRHGVDAEEISQALVLHEDDLEIGEDTRDKERELEAGRHPNDNDERKQWQSI